MRGPMLLGFGAALRLAAATAALGALAGSANTAACELESGPRGLVARVIDGETLTLEDGTEVRLIGALAPRASDAGGEVLSWPPEAASAAAVSELVLGRPVELAFAGRRADRYGRVLAHVFFERDGRRAWVQGELLLGGHARAYALPQSSECLAELMQYEAHARTAGRGLWSDEAYAERAAYRTRELMRYRGTYQLVTGRIARVAVVNGRAYLNFGVDWREDFTVGIASSVLRAETTWAERLQDLAGRRVRVRGWIERRNGPYIELTDPNQIELLHGAEHQARNRSEGAYARERPAQPAPGALER